MVVATSTAVIAAAIEGGSTLRWMRCIPFGIHRLCRLGKKCVSQHPRLTNNNSSNIECSNNNNLNHHGQCMSHYGWISIMSTTVIPATMTTTVPTTTITSLLQSNHHHLHLRGNYWNGGALTTTSYLRLLLHPPLQQQPRLPNCIIIITIARRRLPTHPPHPRHTHPLS